MVVSSLWARWVLRWCSRFCALVTLPMVKHEHRHRLYHFVHVAAFVAAGDLFRLGPIPVPTALIALVPVW